MDRTEAALQLTLKAMDKILFNEEDGKKIAKLFNDIRASLLAEEDA